MTTAARRGTLAADRLSARLLIGLLLSGLCGLGLGFPHPSAAQQTRQDNSIIRQIYFDGLNLLYLGDYNLAERAFEQARRNAIRTVDARWIDSICYFTMLGEVNLRIRNLKEAGENFESALRLYVQYSDWMLRVQFPARIEPDSNVVAAPPWGQSKRRFRRGRFPNRFNILRGGLRVVNVNNQAAIANVQQLHPLHVDEVVRCSCLAIRRRAELLGPTARYDRLLQEVVKRLSTAQGPANHWSQIWVDLQMGFAFAAMGRKEQAVKAFERSIVVAGEYDHPLTCLAMLELGRLAIKEANHEAGLRWLAEATYSGYYFKRPEIIHEAFELAHIVHMIQQKPDMQPTLGRAARWANSRNLNELRSTLLTAVAEGYAVLGDPKRAVASLNPATRAVKRFDIEHGIYGARYQRVAALVGYLAGDKRSADKSLEMALALMRRGSIRLNHIDVADHAYTNGNIRDRVALELYPRVLADPSPVDWRFDPLESLALLIENRPAALQNWFNAAMKRDDKILALNVVDHIHSRRFTSTLPLGGRLLNLRWILQADPALLSQEAMIQRADLAGRFPRFEALNKEAQGIRKELKNESLFPDKVPLARQQAQRMETLAEIAARQEILLSRIAVSRAPNLMIFPPRQTDESLQQRMRKGEAMLCFHIAPKKHHVFLLTYDRSGHWTVESPQEVKAKLAKLLRAMGNFDPRRPLDAERLADESWREPAHDLMAEIVKGGKVDLGVGVEQLTIIPDGLYWYIPFEALQVGAKGKQLSLVDKARVRYAPTLSLAVPMGLGRQQADQYAIVTGKLFARQDERLTDDAVNRIQRQVPQAHVVDRDSQFRGDVAASFLNGLVVLDDLESSAKDPFLLAPMQVDEGKPGAALGEWMGLPWGGPQVVILPGYHTPAENALKKLRDGTRMGDEMFLTTMGLLATGTRTVLFSRWLTGGRTANGLIAEFLQELPNLPADDAWQRSVQVNRELPLDPEFEPRVEASDGVNALASHPFFWSGYLLVDQGVNLPLPLDEPQKDDKAPP